MFQLIKKIFKIRKNEHKTENDICETEEEIVSSQLQNKILYKTDIKAIFDGENLNKIPSLTHFFEFCHQMRLAEVDYYCFIRIPEGKNNIAYLAVDVFDIDKAKTAAIHSHIKLKKTAYEINPELINPYSDIIEPAEQRIFTKLKSGLNSGKLAYFADLYHSNNQ